MKKLITFIFIFLLANVMDLAYAQKKGKDKTKEKARDEAIIEYTEDQADRYDRAEYLFDDKNYLAALELYLTLENDFPDDPYFKYKAGICYLYKTDEKKKAITYLEAAYSKDPEFEDILLYLGRAYSLNYKFDLAIEYFNYYISKEKAPLMVSLANHYIANANNGKILTANPIDAQIDNLGAPVNTKYSEYTPIVSADESVLIFTYRGIKSKGGLMDEYLYPDPDGEYYEDIFISNRLGNKWLKAESIGDNINTLGHDAAIALSSDGEKLFVFKSTNKNKGDIYVSFKNEKEWSVPVPLGPTVNSKYWEGSCSLSSDENTLYFSSERPGGYGGKDLYKAIKQVDGQWGPAINLGGAVNTPYNDDSPFIHHDGVTLFYSSEGHNSMGGYDIFSTRMENNDGSSWSKPENLGYPINTTSDDVFYVLAASGETGYYSSTTEGGLGEQDIYTIKAGLMTEKPVVALVRGKITANSKPVESDITITNADNGELVRKIKTNAASGKYLFSLPPGNNYKIVFDVERAEPHTETVNAKNLETYVQIDKNLTYVTDKKSKDKHLVLVDTTANIQERLEKEQQVNIAEQTQKINKSEIYAEILKESGNEQKQGVTYLVDLGTYKNIDEAKFEKLNKIAPIQKQATFDNRQRLTAGPFNTLVEAEAFKTKLIQADSSFAVKPTEIKVNDQGTVKNIKEYYSANFQKALPKETIPIDAKTTIEEKQGTKQVVKTQSGSKPSKDTSLVAKPTIKGKPLKGEKGVAPSDSLAKVKSDATAKIQAEAQARAKIKADSIARAKEEAKMQEQARLLQAKGNGDSIAKIKSEAAAKAKSEALARKAEAKIKADSIAKLKSEAAALAREEAKIKSDSIAKIKSEAAALAKAEALERKAAAKAKSDSIVKARIEKQAQLRAEAIAKRAEAKSKSSIKNADAEEFAREQAEEEEMKAYINPNNSAAYNKLLLSLGKAEITGVSYKLEIGGLNNPTMFNLVFYEKYGNIEKKDIDGVTHYYIGSYKTLAEVEMLKNKILTSEKDSLVGKSILPIVFYKDQPKGVEEFFYKRCDPVVAYDFAREFVGANLNSRKVYKDFLRKCGRYECDDLLFKVQIGAYRFPKNFKYPQLAEFGPAEVIAYPDSIVRFTLSEFKNFADAEELRQKVIKKGIKDAWIPAFYKEDRKVMDEVIRNNFYLKQGL